MPQAPKDSLKTAKIIVIAMGISMLGAIIFVLATIIEKSRNTSKQANDTTSQCAYESIELPIAGKIRTVWPGPNQWLVELEATDATHLFFITPCSHELQGEIVAKKTR